VSSDSLRLTAVDSLALAQALRVPFVKRGAMVEIALSADQPIRSVDFAFEGSLVPLPLRTRAMLQGCPLPFSTILSPSGFGLRTGLPIRLPLLAT
jgi:hypothetical protein